MTHRCTLHVEVADHVQLAAVIAAIETLGAAVACPVFDEWSRLRARDEFLREAHGLMSGTPWGRCVALEKEITRFESLVWPGWREREAPPEPCSALRRHLFHARRCGPLPSTARHLWNIMKRGRPCDFGDEDISSAPDLERGI